MFRPFFFTLALGVAAGCGGGSSGGASGSQPGAVQPTGGAITMEVTEAGFVPARLKIKRGEPVKLLITRKTEASCATEIVIDEYKVNTKLPLDTPVTVSFTPTKTGTLKYGCAMQKMIGGVITVI